MGTHLLDLQTPVGPARAHVHHRAGIPPDSPAGTLVLGHGAGGGLDAVDLVAVTAAATGLGWRVVGVEQPWKVAGRKVAGPPAQLDAAWRAVVEALVAAGLVEGRLVLGGRSAGARVACRTATALAAHAVCCLAFPLHPPGRPERSRAQELAAAAIPTLIVQGRRDAFGTAEEVSRAARALGAAHLAVVDVDGDHGLKTDPTAVAAAVADFLRGRPQA